MSKIPANSNDDIYDEVKQNRPLENFVNSPLHIVLKSLEHGEGADMTGVSEEDSRSATEEVKVFVEASAEVEPVDLLSLIHFVVLIFLEVGVVVRTFYDDDADGVDQSDDGEERSDSHLGDVFD